MMRACGLVGIKIIRRTRVKYGNAVAILVTLCEGDVAERIGADRVNINEIPK